MRVIMTGGGTGGHVYPAIAIADEIKRRSPESEIIFVGTDHGMENNIVPAAGYELRHITVTGMYRKKLWKNFKTAKDLKKGLGEAKQIINDFKPDAVIGTGGYVCGPMVFEAQRMGIKTYIHEQNAFPGLTNKLLSRNVDKVFLAFEEAASHFKSAKSVITVGNPVRHAFREVDRATARQKLGVSCDDFVVLGFGGSLGASRINNEMKIVAEELKDNKNFTLFFATGSRFYDAIAKSGENYESNIKYMKYIDDMPTYLAACDIAVTRSGALTVSEIAACGRASIMIPSPNVTHNHQFFNAKVLADCGASILIEEKDLNEGDVATIIETLIEDRKRLEQMELMAADKDRGDASGTICEHIGIE